jgi:sugar/nucleoside kinase (ribokinase family)
VQIHRKDGLRMKRSPSHHRVAVLSRHLAGPAATMVPAAATTTDPVFLVGSMIADVQAELSETGTPSFRMDVANQASSVGKVTHTAGGVCLNIARALRALGTGPVHLVSAVGPDASGRELLEVCSEAGICTKGVLTIRNGRTATVLCLFNHRGEVVFSLADVSILEDHVTPAMALNCMARCEYSGGIVVTDGDLPSEVLKTVCSRSRTEGCTVVFDPATVGKAPRCLECLQDIDFLFPNVDELREISDAIYMSKGRDRGPVREQLPLCACGVPEVFHLCVPAVTAVLGRGVRHVVLTAGEHGAGMYWYRGTALELMYCPALPVPIIASVSGAGDCLVAGFVRSLSLGRRKEEALALGVASAWEALQTKSNVPSAPGFDGARLAANAWLLESRIIKCAHGKK